MLLNAIEVGRRAVGYDVKLLISCPDKRGLIAAVSGFMAMHDGNILSSDQYVSDSGLFFMRLEVEGEGFGLRRGSSAPRSPRSRAGTGWTGA